MVEGKPERRLCRLPADRSVVPCHSARLV